MAQPVEPVEPVLSSSTNPLAHHPDHDRALQPSRVARSEREPDLLLRVKRLSEHAKLPLKKSALAAGYDLFSAATMTLAPGTRALVPTDIAMSIPPGTYGRIAPRSGLAVKHGIHTLAGVIDADYRGHVQVLLQNLDPVSEARIEKGDRIAQLVLEKIAMGVEVMEVQVLEKTERGEGGFGSTGLA